jgi:hypothetical protein
MRDEKIEDAASVDKGQSNMPFRLQCDRLVHAYDMSSPAMSVYAIAFIRLCRSRRGQMRLTLEAVDGRKIALRWNDWSPEAHDFVSLSEEILTRVSRRNQFVAFSIGPSKVAWFAAWIGLILSLSVIVGMTWAAVIGRGLPTVSLPLALAPIFLVRVLPILLDGPCRTVSRQQLLNALSDHHQAAHREH